MIEASESRFILKMTGQIAKHAETDWRAGMEMLARRFPGEFAKDRAEPTDPRKDDGWSLENDLQSPAYRETLREMAAACDVIDEAQRQGKPWRLEGVATIVVGE